MSTGSGRPKLTGNSAAYATVPDLVAACMEGAREIIEYAIVKAASNVRTK